MIYQIDTRAFANAIEPGTIVDTADGTRVPVARVKLGYNSVTLTDATGRETTVGYADLVTVRGYYNP